MSQYERNATYGNGCSQATCPYCAHEWQQDDWYPSDEEELETECPSCEKPLLLSASHRITIKSYRKILKEEPA